MSRDLPRPPKDRQGFKIGIVCALSLEADMVEMVFDKRWKKDGIKYGQAENDPNSYTPGVIAGHNVVLTYCPAMGSNSAAQVATSLLSSFSGIKIVLVVGICGAVPSYLCQEEMTEIVLGDCLISTGIVQFDLGQRGPDGFVKKDGLNGLGRAGNQIRAIMTKLQTQTNKLELTESLHSHLETLQKMDSKRTEYLGAQHDKLYESSYVHMHQPPTCNKCDINLGICGSSCLEIGCDEQHLRSRENLQSDPAPRIHFGLFGSSNTVLKYGLERDALAAVDNLIAFEMEGSGIWDVCPTVVIKAACDYADSHKNKKWQPYAAAVAAAGMKAFLQELELPYDEGSQRGISKTGLDAKSAHEHMIANGFSHSINHGIQAGTIHGGIHHHYNNATSQLNEQVEQTVVQADSIIHDSNTSIDRLKIERLSGETLSLEKCYINLALIQQSDRTRDSVEKSSFSLQARLELGAKDPKSEVSLEELFTARKLANGSFVEPRRIYIRGRAGVGKSTLCKKIVYEFDHQRFGNGLFDRLLWLPLRQLTDKSNKNDEYGWGDFIHDAYPLSDPKWKQVVDVFSAQLYEPDFLGRTLLLLDGLDELTQEWNQNDKMFKFLERIIQRSPNIIITSRPQANNLAIGDFDLELETLGFSLEQVDAYLENCISNSDVVAKMKLFMEARPLIQGLLRIPIQLDAFCCAWPSEDSDVIDNNFYSTNDSSTFNPKNLTTMTSLYLSISFELCRKDIGRREGQGRSRGLGDSEVSQLFADEFRVLEELAFQGIVNNVIAYSPKIQDIVLSYLSQNGVQLQIPYNSILRRLSFLRSSYIEQDPSKRNYHFLHLTFQEFFAARHFVRRWLIDSRLICLKLAASSEKKEISPVAFLRTRKYNPRYNMFWRFVTGLTQIQVYENDGIDVYNQGKSVVTLFKHLLDEPIDLLEIQHPRLLMYCLSEVSYSIEPAVQNLRKEIEEMLRDVMVRGYNSSRYSLSHQLPREAEYPEGALRSCLQNEGHPPHSVTLEILQNRPLLSPETSDAIAPFLDHKSDPELSYTAAVTILEGWRTSSKEALTRAIWKSITMLDSEDTYIQGRSVKTLEQNPCLPKEVVVALLAIFRDGSLKKRVYAGQLLACQSSPPQEFWDILLAMPEDTDLKVRNYVQDILMYIDNLPQQILTALLWMLRNGNQEKRSFATNILGQMALQHEDFLSEQDIDMLFAWFLGEDCEKHDSAVTLLSTQPYLPKEIVTTLTAMLKDEDPSRRSSALSLLEEQSYLPKEIVNDLTAMLGDEDPGLRSSAALSLKFQVCLSQEIKTGLIAMLKDEDADLRRCAVIAFSWQLSLDQEVFSALLAIFKNNREDAGLRRSAANVLKRNSSMPREFINVLLAILQDKNSSDSIREHAVEALELQVSLSEQDITALLTIFKDEDEGIEIRRSIVRILQCQSSLSQKATTTLIAILRNASFDMRLSNIHVQSVHKLSKEDMISVVTMLKDKGGGLYNLLHQSDVYTLIASLDDQTWKQLWSFWLDNGDKYDMSCYELEGSLYVWSGGTLHRVSADPKRTKELLNVVLTVNSHDQESRMVGKLKRKRTFSK